MKNKDELFGDGLSIISKSRSIEAMLRTIVMAYSDKTLGTREIRDMFCVIEALAEDAGDLAKRVEDYMDNSTD